MDVVVDEEEADDDEEVEDADDAGLVFVVAVEVAELSSFEAF